MRGRRIASRGYRRGSLKARLRCLLGHDRDDPARWVARLNFHYRTDHPSDWQSIQHHCRLFAPVLGAAAALGLYSISNFDSLHASPVRNTAPRRFPRSRSNITSSRSLLCVAFPFQQGINLSLTVVDCLIAASTGLTYEGRFQRASRHNDPAPYVQTQLEIDVPIFHQAVPGGCVALKHLKR
jgi:hypothetical protein